MCKQDFNQIRLVAAEIVHKLWDAGETNQLELLLVQVEASVEHPKADQ